MLTIEDIRNPERKSGFDHVSSAKGGQPTSGGENRRRAKWRAEVYDASRSTVKSGMAWHGVTRSNPEEAAQDYCDYINAQSATATAQLKRAGHEPAQRESLPRDPEVEAALGVLRDAKAQRQGRQGYVYCIGEGQGATPGYGVKIGYSVNPPKRVIELQTGNPRVLHLLGRIEGTEADERRLHTKYINYNLIGEWFVPTPELLSEFGLNASGQPRQVPSAEGEAA